MGEETNERSIQQTIESSRRRPIAVIREPVCIRFLYMLNSLLELHRNAFLFLSTLSCSLSHLGPGLSAAAVEAAVAMLSEVCS